MMRTSASHWRHRASWHLAMIMLGFLFACGGSDKKGSLELEQEAVFEPDAFVLPDAKNELFPREVSRVREVAEGAASWLGQATPDGRFVAFQSAAGNLVESDQNDQVDIFLRDTRSGRTELVSVANDGSQANGPSSRASVSGDGRYVVFQSDASNLVEGDDNGATDIFIRDRQERVTTVVSRGASGEVGNGNSTDAVIAAGGGHVAFLSKATNLVQGDRSDLADVFLYDVGAGTIENLTQGADQKSGPPTVSAGGRYVVFGSDATNLVKGDHNDARDVFIVDALTNRIHRLMPELASEPNNDNFAPHVSLTGRFIAFHSAATNWIGEATGSDWQVYVYDRVESRVDLASRGPSGPGNARSYGATVSEDGRYVAFESLADNLAATGADPGMPSAFRHDLQSGETIAVAVDRWGTPLSTDAQSPRIVDQTGDVVFHTGMSPVDDERDRSRRVLVYSTEGVRTDVLSVSRLAPPSKPGTASCVSRDGRVIAFSSIALEPNDAHSLGVYDASSDDAVEVHWSTAPSTLEIVRSCALSGDGRYVAFIVSEYSKLDGGALVYDRKERRLTRLTNKYTSAISMSDDGRYVVALTDELIDLEADFSGDPEVYLFDLTDGSARLISRGPDGTSIPGEKSHPNLSPDGALVAFVSNSALDPLDTNGQRDIYLARVASGDVERVTDFPQSIDTEWRVFEPRLVGDGSEILFSTTVPLDVADDDVGLDVYTLELESRSYELHSQEVERSTAAATDADISDDGSLLCFGVLGREGYLKNRVTGALQPLQYPGEPTTQRLRRMMLSGNGEYAVYERSTFADDDPREDQRAVFRVSVGGW